MQSIFLYAVTHRDLLTLSVAHVYNIIHTHVCAQFAFVRDRLLFSNPLRSLSLSLSSRSLAVSNADAYHVCAAALTQGLGIPLFNSFFSPLFLSLFLSGIYLYARSIMDGLVLFWEARRREEEEEGCASRREEYTLISRLARALFARE